VLGKVFAADDLQHSPQLGVFALKVSDFLLSHDLPLQKVLRVSSSSGQECLFFGTHIFSKRDSCTWGRCHQCVQTIAQCIHSLCKSANQSH
jgi:hypothetical protein